MSDAFDEIVWHAEMRADMDESPYPCPVETALDVAREAREHLSRCDCRDCLGKALDTAYAALEELYLVVAGKGSD
ncbi:hypothetical protein AB0J38_23450 [Streptomyces sp. NPDC050095]|uniref:hypothetical protein n=1 Tax=unclassified Streptomyces TaxID=2593676 RepID=UPI0034231F76